jgi:hypothetical protein
MFIFKVVKREFGFKAERLEKGGWVLGGVEVVAG